MNLNAAGVLSGGRGRIESGYIIIRSDVVLWSKMYFPRKILIFKDFIADSKHLEKFSQVLREIPEHPIAKWLPIACEMWVISLFLGSLGKCSNPSALKLVSR